jgi:DNA polymerase-1
VAELKSGSSGDLGTPGSVYLIDASPYIFRAHHSLPSSIRTPEGAPAAASRGFATFLLGLIETEAPAYLGVAFDRQLNSSFRNETYPDYKAHRDPAPPEIEAQIDTCFEIAGALGAATYIDERYEADDLIATIARQIAEKPNPVVIVTSDKDLAQLVDARISLLDAAKGVRYTPAEVEEKFGVRPEQVVDLLALAGDAVDNIPGVKGIGAKGAAALLAHFGTLDRLYTGLEEVASLPLRGAKSLQEKLAAGRDSAFLSRTLATVYAKVPGVRGGLKDLAFRGADPARIDPLFARLGFGSLRGRIRRPSETEPPENPL